MSKVSLFKEFVSNNPEFIDSVNSGKTTWQKLYELYDLYGENDKVWDSYRKINVNKTDNSSSVKNIISNLKNINLDSLEENIDSLRKAVGFLEELALTTKKEDNKENINKNKKHQVIERFYDD